MRRALIIAAFWFFGCAASAHAQIAPAADNPCARVSPGLSVEECLRWQILQLQTSLETAISQANSCQGELGSWRARASSAQLTADEQVLKSFIEQHHPGQDWNPKTGAFSPKPPDPTPPAAGPKATP